MSAVAAPQRAARRSQSSADPLWSVYRVELEKLFAQLAIRLLVLVCALGPFAFARGPEDPERHADRRVFGVWSHSTGFAMSLVILSFAGSWGFPLIAGVVAGDMFSSEDRNNTWKMILVRSCTRGEVFTGKLLAAVTLTSALLVLTMVSSIAAGAVFVGRTRSSA